MSLYQRVEMPTISQISFNAKGDGLLAYQVKIYKNN